LEKYIFFIKFILFHEQNNKIILFFLNEILRHGALKNSVFLSLIVIRKKRQKDNLKITKFEIYNELLDVVFGIL